MANTSILFGLLLAALGPIGYFGVQASSPGPTPFIPTVVGVILIICGLVAKQEHMRKHAMHVAVLVALLGFLAAFGRVAMVLATGVIKSRMALTMSGLMSALCAIFVVLCVRSFIQARRARQAKPS